MCSGINIGNLLPFGGKVLVVRTIWKWHSGVDDNLSIATDRLEDGEDLTNLTVARH